MLQQIRIFLSSKSDVRFIMRIAIGLIILILGLTDEALCQDRRPYEQTFRLPIEKLVKAQYGKDYEVGIEVIDSVLNTEACSECDEINDPYGTLKGCVLFSATRSFALQDSGFFGIYKNGQFLWRSDRIIQGEWDNTFATYDINGDGEVDILTTWEQDGYPGLLYMWIFSWNGTIGRIINASDGQGTSMIQGHEFKLIPMKEGLYGIEGELYSGESVSSQVYNWNGSLYVPQ